jgi:hypothetical protein
VAEVQQRFSTEIDAPAALCYTAIADFDAYPSWSSPITEVHVQEHYGDGMPRRVEFFLDMKLRTIRYVLEYVWHPPGRLTWTMVDGDVSDIAGSYLFEPLEDGRTRATCSQAISLGFWVPGLIRKPLEQTALKQSVLEFKAEAGARAARRAERRAASKRADGSRDQAAARSREPLLPPARARRCAAIQARSVATLHTACHEARPARNCDHKVVSPPRVNVPSGSSASSASSIVGRSSPRIQSPSGGPTHGAAWRLRAGGTPLVTTSRTSHSAGVPSVPSAVVHSNR